MAKAEMISSKKLAEVGAEDFENTKLVNGYDNAGQTIIMGIQFKIPEIRENVLRLLVDLGDSPENIDARYEQLARHHSNILLAERSDVSIPIPKKQLQNYFSVVAQLLPEKDPQHGREAIDALFKALDIKKLTAKDDVIAAAAELFDIEPKRGKNIG